MKRAQLAIAVASLLGCLIPQVGLAQTASSKPAGQPTEPVVTNCRPNSPKAIDYRLALNDVSAGKSYSGLLYQAENAHFRSQVEQLVSGLTSRRPGPDIEYLLRIFPNHYRALVALTKLTDRTSRSPLVAAQDISEPTDCFFERGISLKIPDSKVQLIYIDYLANTRRPGLASNQLKQLLHQHGDEPLVHYFAGLLYLKIGNHDAALQQAHRALSLGVDRPDLRVALEKSGRWREPVLDTSAAQPASAPAVPASGAPQ